MRARWIALSLAAALGAAPAHADTASVAAALEDEQAECKFLLLLCVEAGRARERADATPRTGGTEALVFKQEREAELRTRDAVEAARVILERHEGKRPACFGAPDCAFLKDALGAH